MRYRLVAKLSSATVRCHEGVRREYSSEYFLRLPFSETPLTRRELLLRASRPRDGLSDASLASWNVYSPKFIWRGGRLLNDERREIKRSKLKLRFSFPKSGFNIFPQTKRSDFLSVQFTRDSFLEMKEVTELKFISTPRGAEWMKLMNSLNSLME